LFLLQDLFFHQIVIEIQTNIHINLHKLGPLNRKTQCAYEC
jgi:hypothetical protein